jgi:hypothetical protein
MKQWGSFITKSAFEQLTRAFIAPSMSSHWAVWRFFQWQSRPQDGLANSSMLGNASPAPPGNESLISTLLYWGLALFANRPYQFLTRIKYDAPQLPETEYTSIMQTFSLRESWHSLGFQMLPHAYDPSSCFQP